MAYQIKSNELLEVESLVLVKVNNVPPFHCPLGRMTSLFPGQDCVVRVVEVWVSGHLLKSAVTKVYVFPLK
ncbi:hypothetical protein NQ314_005612 [Rhamnusium bicolor]|uniref:DUF5641 domain-containing protein n=1 Tax=Rhamnusium bicolor TaxID=1586634 RepID=A0AAV8ZFQ9_9CUCU|nr:hypothetical protein NQ314_005612 [Rhamnusium bicolor]